MRHRKFSLPIHNSQPSQPNVSSCTGRDETSGSVGGTGHTRENLHESADLDLRLARLAKSGAYGGPPGQEKPTVHTDRALPGNANPVQLATVAPAAQGERVDLDTSPPGEGKSAHASEERLRAIAERAPAQVHKTRKIRGLRSPRTNHVGRYSSLTAPIGSSAPVVGTVAAQHHKLRPAGTSARAKAGESWRALMPPASPFSGPGGRPAQSSLRPRSADAATRALESRTMPSRCSPEPRTHPT
jgi:hypothetical protein